MNQARELPALFPAKCVDQIIKIDLDQRVQTAGHLFAFHGEFERIGLQPGSEVSLVDAPARLQPGQSLNVRRAIEMRIVHDRQSVLAREAEYRSQDMHDKVHRGYIVIVNDDSIEGFPERLLCWLIRLLRDELAAQLHGRHYKPAEVSSSKYCQILIRRDSPVRIAVASGELSHLVLRKTDAGCVQILFLMRSIL